MRILVLVLAILVWPMCGSGTIISVGNGHTIKSIKEAIRIASPGDQIQIQTGLYKEKNLIIDKPISLVGIGLPVLDGENQFEILSIKSNHVRIKGLKIIRSGHSSMQDLAGVKIYDCDDVSVSDNQIQNCFFGIYLQYSKNCLIQNNVISSTATLEQEIGNGIHCWKSDSLHISKNKISGHRDGIYFEFVTNSSIRGNYSQKNLRYGLHFMFSHNDAYLNNTFRQNGAGVAVMFTHGVKMFNNRFEDNWGDASYGLLLKEISDSEIEGNRFKNNTSGIYMEGASRVTVKKNRFEQNGWAIKIQASCMDVNVEKNNFLGNSFDVGTNGSLVLNQFNGNYWDKYEGYDLNRDKMGDIPYRPVSLFSVLVEKMPVAMILFRTIMVTLIDRSEKILPSITPGNLVDNKPLMNPILL